jgi:hypothetical protein
MSPTSLERARVTRDAIAGDTRRTNGPIFAAMARTLLPTLLTFLIALTVSGYARAYVAGQFGDPGLTSLTALSTTLAVLAVSWLVFRGAERRFGGMVAFRGMFAVVLRIAALDRAIEAAQRTDDPDDDTLLTAADEAWQTYNALLNRLGLQPPSP